MPYRCFVCSKALRSCLDPTRMSRVVLLAVIFLMPPASSGQVISPGNSTLPTQPANQDQAQAEPSIRLLDSLQSMIPFNMKTAGIYDAMLSATRKFTSGVHNEALSQLEEIRKGKAELPPPQLVMAGLFFGSGDIANARALLESVVVTEPDYPTSWTALARLSINDRRFADAQAVLEKVAGLAERESWSPEQKKHFRIEYLDGLSDLHIARLDTEGARAALQELNGLAPANFTVPLRLARIEFDAGDTEKSLKYLQEARILSPEVRVPETIIAEWFTQANRPEDAERWVAMASEKNPNDVMVMIDHARWLLNAEKFPEALIMVARIEEKGSHQLLCDFMKGQIAFARREYDSARVIFDKVLSQKPGDADTVNMLALSLIESQVVNDRERALELAIVNQRLYPRSTSAAATVAWIYYKIGRIPDAESIFQQVAQASNTIEPNSAWFFANFLNGRGEAKAAARLLEEAVASRTFFMYRASAQDLLIKLTSGSSGEENQGQDPPAASGSTDKKDGNRIPRN
jgi:predicted Zn-dependent protease